MDQQGMEKRQFGHRARLALSPAQTAVLDGQAHAARTLWNLLHDWWAMLPRDKRTLAAADAAIRQARAEVDWLGVLPAQAAQAVLKTYFQAWKSCWERRAGAPEFKARFRTVMSVDIPQGRDLHVVRMHRRWGMVNIPKLGRIRFCWTKDLPVGSRADNNHRITGARLVKNAFGWHIAFRVQTLQPKPEPHMGPEVGIDVGITIPLSLSDGEQYDHGPWLTPKEQAKLLHWEQRAARRKERRKKGERTSRRLTHTYDQIARIRATAKRRRDDWQHKTTTEIATKYGTVVVEALTITNMTASAKGTIEAPGRNVAQKTGLNRSILGEAWGRTVEILTYKLAHRGGTLAKVPAPGTSLRCSHCRTITRAVGRPRPCSYARTLRAAGRATPTTTPHSTTCTCTGRATRSSRLPGGQSQGAHAASSPPPQGRRESPSLTRENTSNERAHGQDHVFTGPGLARPQQPGPDGAVGA